MNGIVIDASVVLKWYLVDEDHGGKALEILTRFLSGALALHAPSLLAYEVMNGLSVARERGRIGWDILETAVEGFLHLGMDLSEMGVFSGRIPEFIKAFDISSYDACYLALAESRGELFITADEALCEAVGDECAWVKRLEDFAVSGRT